MYEEAKYGLDRHVFSESFGDAILNYKEKECIVIGLSGEWGSGKTSIVNMAIEHIKSETKGLAEQQKPRIIRFNPWNFSNQNQLILKFFDELNVILRTEEDVLENLELYLKKLIPFQSSYEDLQQKVKPYSNSLSDIAVGFSTLLYPSATQAYLNYRDKKNRNLESLKEKS